MKKLISILVFFVLIAQVRANHYTKIKPSLKASEMFVPVGNSGKMISLQELAVIKVNDLETLTGQKMTIAEKLMLKGAQKQLRNHIHKDGTLDKSFTKTLRAKQKSESKDGSIFGVGFNLLGLALGLFLSLIGVLIAYLLNSEDKGSLITWAWIGCAISLVVWGALLL
jgi:hypothetical protein